MTSLGIKRSVLWEEKARGIPAIGYLLKGIVCLLAILLCTPQSTAQSQSELEVKAAFVFNLTKYVDWPTQKNQLVIGIVGNGPMVGALRETLTGMVSDSRPIEVLISPSDAELRSCDLLYVAYSSAKKIELVLEKTSPENVLTVGDAASFTKQGGMVALLTVGDHVEIHVNVEASQKAKLKISSRLLSLAKVTNSSGSNARN